MEANTDLIVMSGTSAGQGLEDYISVNAAQSVKDAYGGDALKCVTDRIVGRAKFQRAHGEKSTESVDGLADALTRPDVVEFVNNHGPDELILLAFIECNGGSEAVKKIVDAEADLAMLYTANAVVRLTKDPEHVSLLSEMAGRYERNGEAVVNEIERIAREKGRTVFNRTHVPRMMELYKDPEVVTVVEELEGPNLYAFMEAMETCKMGCGDYRRIAAVAMKKKDDKTFGRAMRQLGAASTMKDRTEVEKAFERYEKTPAERKALYSFD